MKVALFGAGGHGKVVFDLLRSGGEHQVVGWLDDDPKKHGTSLEGAKVLGGRELLGKTAPGAFGGVILAVGSGAVRHQVAKLCEASDLKLIGFVHPRAVVSARCKIDPSAMIWPQAVVQIGTTIGKGVIVNTGAIIEHDCRLADYSFVAPGAVLCGSVSVGERSWIGAGAVVLNNLKVGSDTMIGAGAVVVKDIGSKVTAYGVPCRAK